MQSSPADHLRVLDPDCLVCGPRPEIRGRFKWGTGEVFLACRDCFCDRANEAYPVPGYRELRSRSRRTWVEYTDVERFTD